MNWRFRRSINAESGDRVNIGKRTSSLTVGGRGAKTTTGGTNTPVSSGLSAPQRHPGLEAPPSPADVQRAMMILARHEEWEHQLGKLAHTAQVRAHCVREGETAGPMPLRDIVNMAAVGIVDHSTQVLIEGGSEWHPIEPELIATARRIDHPIYFYGSPEGLECGPYQASALRDLFRSFGLPANTPVYRRGDGMWRTLDELPECSDDETLRSAQATLERYYAAMAWPRRPMAVAIAVTLAMGVVLGFALASVLIE